MRAFYVPADSTPMPKVAEWKFKGGGWLQVYQLPERPGSGSFTLTVSNIGEEVLKMSSLGIDTSQQSSGEKVKTLMVTDTDRNHIASPSHSIRAWLSESDLFP